jgi:hypothetical protein
MEKTINGILNIIIPEKRKIIEGITESNRHLTIPLLFHIIAHTAQYAKLSVALTAR